MKIRWITTIALSLLLSGSLVYADNAPEAKQGSLEDQLKALDEGNQAPAAVSREKLYAVQTRYLPLKYKSEVTVGGAYDLTADSFLRTQQLQAGYRFHLSDRWALGLAYAWVDNHLKSEVNNLRTVDNAIPNVPYAKSRYDLMVEYNVFYGKFRWSADTVSYFDQYIAVGPGVVVQNNGTVGAAVGDIGFAFWLGRWGSARAGLKEYYYNETYPSGKQLSSNLHAHVDIGYIF